MDFLSMTVFTLDWSSINYFLSTNEILNTQNFIYRRHWESILNDLNRQERSWCSSISVGQWYHDRRTTQQKMICYMRCVNAFFIDITNIFVNMTDFSCHFNQKDTLRIPNECLCVILTYYFLLCRIARTSIHQCFFWNKFKPIFCVMQLSIIT